MSDMDLHPTDRAETIGDRLATSGVSRRRFLDFCLKMMAAAPLGLSLTKHATPEAVASEIEKARRPSVIWLHMQDCTGCSETLLRTSTPDVGDLILDLISLDYHETLMVASGHQAEAALHDAMEENKGKYVVVVEGSIPTAEMGQYLYIAGKKGTDIIKEVCADAAACIAIGSCATWGGIPSAPPNPTGATGLDSLVKDKPVVNIPGCPPNPYNLLGVVLQYATAGTLPALDDKGRPTFAYGRRIHEHCPRRAHFDAGRFVQTFGDQGHKEGWCLYQVGCKGPETYAPCSTRHFNEVVDAWPIGIGAPCFGCTEEHLAFKAPYFDKAKIHDATPPNTYPPIEADAGEGLNPWAVGAVGAAAGAIAAGAAMASGKFSDKPGDDSVPGEKKGD